MNAVVIGKIDLPAKKTPKNAKSRNQPKSNDGRRKKTDRQGQEELSNQTMLRELQYLKKQLRSEIERNSMLTQEASIVRAKLNELDGMISDLSVVEPQVLKQLKAVREAAAKLK